MESNDEALIRSHALMRRLNRAKVMNAIRLYAPISRSAIADRVALDRKSITNFVAELTRTQWVQETGIVKIERGRPQTLLSFNRNRNLAAGIYIDADATEGVLIDVYGNVVSQHELSYRSDAPAEEIFAAVQRVYAALRAAHAGNLLGAGVVVPGVLDATSRVLVESEIVPALNGMDLHAQLTQRLRERIFVENSSLAKGLAEKWFGLGRNTSSFVSIDLGIGVGAGIIHAGRPFKGASGHSGEIGHVMVEPGGRPCGCGNRGCLEAYVSERRVLADINTAAGAKHRRLADVPLTAESKAIIRSAAFKLGVALASVVNLICPTTIVLNGALMTFADVVLPEVARGAQQHSVKSCLNSTRILVSELRHASALGAATLALADTFEVKGLFYV